MDCNNCNIIDICKIYDLAKSYSHIADINITNCKKNSKKETTENRNISQPNERKIRDFTKQSNQARLELEKVKNDTYVTPKKNFQVVPMEKESLVTCPSCSAKTIKEDIKKCDQCGKEVCSNCGVEDPETHKIICEDCFMK